MTTAASPSTEKPHTAANAADADQLTTYPADNLSSTTDTEKTPVGLAPLAAVPEPDVAPDGGYGWVVVACVFMINAHTWGINSSYGVFLSYYLQHGFFPGASPLEYAFVGGLSIAMSQVVSPLATYLIRRWGIYIPLLSGIVLQTSALLGASFATSIWHLFLSQGVCFGLGMGLIFNATVGLIPQWFDKRRSFANSIGTAGSGMGGLIYSLATQAMIESLGLGWAFRILAICSCAVICTATLLIRDRNVAVGAIYNAFDLRLLRRPQFLLTLAWACFSMVGYVNLLFSLPNYAVSIGLTATQASVVGAILNLGQGIGRPLIGYFSDSLGRINMCLFCTLGCGILCFALWIPAESYALLLVFALLGGGVAGTLWTTVAPVTAEVVGLSILPSALSLVWVSLVLPSTFAEVISLELRRDQKPIYRDAQVFTGMMYVGAAMVLWFVRAWKVREGETERVEKEGVGNGNGEGLQRTRSVARSVRSVAVASRGLWVWAKV
ncbi:hypothetical protein VE02_05476 [Pseudogymnoascus sp. 03VT05]|nr:hypothetical protein VE02_05476 [Pseudogymnoascus sp. 03VT05]